MRDIKRLLKIQLIRLDIQKAALDGDIAEASGSGQDDLGVQLLKKMRLSVEDTIAEIKRRLDQLESVETKAA